MFSSPCVCLFVGHQDCAETLGPISMKFGRLIWNDNRKKPLKFGDDPDHIRRWQGLHSLSAILAR